MLYVRQTSQRSPSSVFPFTQLCKISGRSARCGVRPAWQRLVAWGSWTNSSWRLSTRRDWARARQYCTRSRLAAISTNVCLLDVRALHSSLLNMIIECADSTGGRACALGTGKFCCVNTVCYPGSGQLVWQFCSINCTRISVSLKYSSRQKWMRPTICSRYA